MFARSYSIILRSRCYSICSSRGISEGSALNKFNYIEQYWHDWKKGVRWSNFLWRKKVELNAIQYGSSCRMLYWIVHVAIFRSNKAIDWFWCLPILVRQNRIDWKHKLGSLRNLAEFEKSSCAFARATGCATIFCFSLLQTTWNWGNRFRSAGRKVR